MKHISRGYTLIELVIAMAIAALLAALAYPSFRGAILKSRRSDGIAALMQLQLQQEHWRANHPSYGSLAELKAAATSPLGHYTLDIAEPTATGYRLLARATGLQIDDRDCQVLQLRVADGTPQRDAGSSTDNLMDAAIGQRCWNA